MFLKKKDIFYFIASISFVAIVGCSTIRAARDAQEVHLQKSRDGEVATEEKQLRFENLTLATLVEFAMTNRPSMTSAILAVRDSRLAMREIEASAPIASSTPWGAIDISASGSYGERSASAHFSDLKGKTYRGDPSGTLSLNLLIYDFGRNSSRARAQAENIISAEKALIEEGYSVFTEVANAYFSLLTNDALLEVAKTNVVMATEHLQQAEEMLSSGLGKQLDVLNARLQLAKANESVVAATNDVATAGAKLMSAMGIDVSHGVADEVFSSRQKSFENVIREFNLTTNSVVETFAFARTNSPTMCIARAKLRAASANVDFAIADLKPTVSANVSLNWTDPLWYWRWGVDAAQSIFTGWKRTTAVDRAVVAMERASAAVDECEQKISAEIELAIASRENALQAYESANVRVGQAKENLDEVTEKFRIGDASRVDLADATSDFVAALGNRVSAVYRGQIAEAELFRIMGRDPIYRE